jgi:hypothetical protein
VGGDTGAPAGPAQPRDGTDGSDSPEDAAATAGARSRPEASSSAGTGSDAGSRAPADGSDRPDGGAPIPPAPGPGPPDLAGWLRSIPLIPVERDTCSHRLEVPGYRPSPRLRHQVKTRSRRCSFPGSGCPTILLSPAPVPAAVSLPWGSGLDSVGHRLEGNSRSLF